MSFDLKCVLPRTDTPNPYADPHDVYLMTLYFCDRVLDHIVTLLPEPHRSSRNVSMLGFDTGSLEMTLQLNVTRWANVRDVPDQPALRTAVQRALHRASRHILAGVYPSAPSPKP